MDGMDEDGPAILRVTPTCVVRMDELDWRFSASGGAGGAGRVSQWSQLRVATFNVKHGRNGDGSVDLRRLRTACAALSADVLAVQEVDRFARRTGFRDEMRLIARATGLQAVFGEAA